MNYFQVGDRVKTSKKIKAGLHEDGPDVCDDGVHGTILEIEINEWDGIHVCLDNNQMWWFKTAQLSPSNT